MSPDGADSVPVRVPAHLEVTGLIRAVEVAGGFGTVLAKGERDAGTLLVVCCHNGTNARAYERMPQRDGTRKWVLSKAQKPDHSLEFTEYCERRKRQDSDLWLVELDIADGERFIGNLDPLA
jgi:hypothetical protein